MNARSRTVPDRDHRMSQMPKTHHRKTCKSQTPLRGRVSAAPRCVSFAVTAALTVAFLCFNPLIDLTFSGTAQAQSGDGGSSSSGGGKGGGGSNGGSSGGSGSSSNGGSGSGGGGSSGADSSRDRSKMTDEQRKAAAKSAQKSSQSASQKSTSNDLLNRVVGGRRFNGDSEPSGGSLSRSEEREAIDSGWK